MTEVIIRNKRLFAEVLADIRVKDIAAPERVMRAVVETVMRSFGVDARTSLVIAPASDTEIQRRVDICAKWFAIMIEDCKFPVQKAVDFLGTALRADLDGKAWEPPRAGGWTVPDSAVPMVPDGELFNDATKKE